MPVSKPLYQDIAERLVNDIHIGRTPVNSMMPTEIELSRRFSVSRHTIREAMRVLNELKLVVRQPGRGTVVRSNDCQPKYVQSLHSLSEILKYPEETRLNIAETKLTELDSETARLLGARKGEKWSKMSGVRRVAASNKAICWTDVYLKPQYAEIEQQVGKDATPVYRLVEKTFGIIVDSVKVDICADLVNEEIARALNVEEGSPALTVVRKYNTRARRTFEVSVSIHPQERFTYSMELHKEW